MAWSPLVEIVNLDQAKQHAKLPLDFDGEDDDLTLKLLLAHENVFDYLTQRVSDEDEWEAEVDAWTADTAPIRVKGAILAEFAYLYRNRGDGQFQLASGAVVCPEAERLLLRFRDPAVS